MILKIIIYFVFIIIGVYVVLFILKIIDFYGIIDQFNLLVKEDVFYVKMIEVFIRMDDQFWSYS